LCLKGRLIGRLCQSLAYPNHRESNQTHHRRTRSRKLYRASKVDAKPESRFSHHAACIMTVNQEYSRRAIAPQVCDRMPLDFFRCNTKTVPISRHVRVINISTHDFVRAQRRPPHDLGEP
jgi:hypothetical protein